MHLWKEYLVADSPHHLYPRTDGDLYVAQSQHQVVGLAKFNFAPPGDQQIARLPLWGGPTEAWFGTVIRRPSSVARNRTNKSAAMPPRAMARSSQRMLKPAAHSTVCSASPLAPLSQQRFIP